MLLLLFELKFIYLTENYFQIRCVRIDVIILDIKYTILFVFSDEAKQNSRD